jgi:amino acid adenylation domain-containing protein
MSRPPPRAVTKLSYPAMNPNKIAQSTSDVAAGTVAKYVFPTTFQQQRMWFLERLQPGGTAYLISWALRISGKLDVAALEKSLNEIVARHEVLRTTFSWKDDAPVQVVAGTLSVPLPVADLSRADRPQIELEARVREESRKPLDLERGPLVRAQLLRRSDNEHILLLTMHHIVFDGWSRRIFAQELTTLYDAFSRHRPLSLVEPKLQYADYAVWQRKFLRGSILEKQLCYWRQQLADAPAHLDFPFDRPRPALRTSNGATLPIELPLCPVQDFSHRQGVTPYMTLLTVFQILLARYTNQDDIIVGSPIANRNRGGIEDVIGLFANTLALRTRFFANDTFVTVLQRVKETALGAYAHQDLPFEKLVEELQPDRNPSQNPIFQMLFSLQNAPRQAFELPGLTVSFLNMGVVSAKFDLSIFLTEHSDALRGRVEYNTDLFNTSTIERFIEHYRTLLQNAISDPQRRVSELPMMAPEERRLVLSQFKSTRVDFPSGRCLSTLVEESARQRPESTALICGNQRFCYRELNERANQIAHFLIQEGAGPEVLVGVYLERTPNLLPAILGVLKSGAAYVPLDPGFPRDRIRRILEDSSARIILTQGSLAPHLAGTAAQVIWLDRDAGTISRHSRENPDARSAPENLAYVLFTSGSTGRPKGVAIEHRSAVALVDWSLTVFAPEELSSVLFSTSTCFDLSIFEIFVPLSMAGTVVQVQNALALPATEARNQVTLINTVPSAMTELLRMRAIPSSVMTVNLAGEPLEQALVEEIYSSTSVRKVYNLYGPTEDTTYSTYKHVRKGENVTIGRPIANTQAIILDHNRQLVPIGVSGELYLAGEGLARGYYAQPELTAERFINNPPDSDLPARIYRTGDLARFLSSGEIQYRGRVDHQIKLRGYRIELGEIESVLCRHSSVQQAVALVREASPGDKRLLAYVVPRDDSEQAPAIDELRTHLKLYLPDYMIPQTIMVLPSFPLTPNGKIDRACLPEPIQAVASADSFLAPRTEFEAQVAAIWEGLLDVKPVGIRDNFFRLGGHSLLAVRMLDCVEKVTGKKIPVAALLSGATIEYLAEVSERAVPDKQPSLVAIQTHGSKPPFFGVVGPDANSLGYVQLAQRLGDDQPVYKLESLNRKPGRGPYSREELSARALELVETMRSVQPDGPYYFGGMCLGAHIAFEMANHLEARGQKVGALVIFDTWVLQNTLNRLWWIHYYAKRIRLFWRRNWQRQVQELRMVLGNKVTALKLRFTGKSLPEEPWRETYWPKANRLPTINSRITVFAVEKQPFYRVRDESLGWKLRTHGSVELHVVPGDHNSLHRQPYIGRLADELRTSLANAYAEHQPASDTSKLALSTAQMV